MQTSTKAWYVADPVHQFVEFGAYGDLVRALVATRAFQRLRRISQLGLASFVFPGAVHSRFSHSLGAAHLAAILVDDLRIGEERIPEDHAKAIVCAALLHDVGHGPFSHSFEHALGQVLPNRPTHEDWTKAIILNSFGDLLRKHDVDPGLVCALLSSKAEASPVPTFLRQIISSQLDVDRMDYLSRDAHFTGVPIGKIDLQYLVRNIRVIDHGAEERTLGLTAKGVSCYEAFAFARHVMTEAVYYHKQVATFESMMEEFIRLLVESPMQEREPPLIQALRGAGSSDPDSLTRSLYEPYLRITEDQLWSLLDIASDRSDRLGKLATLLLNRTPVPSFLVARHKHEVLDKVLRAAGFKANQFRVRRLKRNLYKESSGEQIFVLGRNGEPSAHIASKSWLVSAFGDHTDTHAVLVIFDESVKAAIMRAAKQDHCLDRGDSIPPSMPPLARTKGDDAPESASKAGG